MADADAISLAFLEPGLVAVGTSDMVRGAVDLKDGGANVTTNDEMMGGWRTSIAPTRGRSAGSTLLTSSAKLPPRSPTDSRPSPGSAPAPTSTAGSAAYLRAETRDDEAANNLRDVVRGFMALAKLQAGSRPEFQGVLQSLQLGGSGKTVALSFDLPAQVFDAIGALAKEHQPTSRLADRRERRSPCSEPAAPRARVLFGSSTASRPTPVWRRTFPVKTLPSAAGVESSRPPR